MTTLPRPMRVTTLVDSLAAGGAERVAVELACALDRSRFAPDVVVSRGDGPLRSLLEGAGVPVTILGRTRRVDAAAWRRAHGLVAGSDLIHAHKFGSNAWGAMLARTARTPLIVHEHNFSARADLARRTIDRHWIAPVARRVICVSESVADIERACGVPERSIEIVPNGVRLGAALPRAAARAELGLADGEYVIGIVGMLRPEKRHELLLEAATLLAASGRSPRICIVGDGPQLGVLQQRAAELGIAQHVVWAGERRDAARLAAAFDLSVICSAWEGLPLAALESMAAGVPLVATAVGGLPDLLGRGAGRLVLPGDSRALAQALAELADNPVAAAALGRAGHERVAEQYTFEQMVRRVEHIYDVVLMPPAARPGASTTAVAGGLAQRLLRRPGKRIQGQEAA